MESPRGMPVVETIIQCLERLTPVTKMMVGEGRRWRGERVERREERVGGTRRFE